MKSGYQLEIDVSAELKIKGIRYYQELIGILRWAIELGRVDIATEVLLLSSHLALPRAGLLQQVSHIFDFKSFNAVMRSAICTESQDTTEEYVRVGGFSV
jgi:hypothetical protein